MALPPQRWFVPACLVWTVLGCDDGEGTNPARTSTNAGASTSSRGGHGGSAGSAEDAAAGMGGTTGGGSTTNPSRVRDDFRGGGTLSRGPRALGSAGATSDACSFEIAARLSSEITSVGVVDWSTDLEGLSEASIEFALDDPEPGELNLEGGGPISVTGLRALMLGLKPGRSYTYRIVVSAGETLCVSPDQSLTTELDEAAPAAIQTLGTAGATRANGFIVSCAYNGAKAFIIDADGDVVWWTSAPHQCSRAQLDWEGEYFWMLKANPGGGEIGEVRRVRMDGSGTEPLAGLGRSHHDFAVLPGGVTAFLVGTDGPISSVVERNPDGALTRVVQLDATAYLSSTDTYHANALRYNARDDSYTVSDLYASLIAKLNRQGQVQWQLSSACEGAPASQCATANVAGSHGHDLLDNGNLLFFAAVNGGGAKPGEASPVYEYAFETKQGVLSATLEWSYAATSNSAVLGDVQRLPNGNTLVTYSTSGIMHEVSPAGALVRELDLNPISSGYAGFRATLYGPPQ